MRICFVAIVACALLMTVASAPALEVRLRAEAEVLGPVATLADIAELQGAEAIVRRAGAIEVQALPDLASYRVEAAEVPALLAGVVATDGLVIAGGPCVVRRRGERFDADAIAATAEAHLREWIGEATRIEVTVERVAGGLAAPAVADRPVRLRAEPLVHRPWGEVPYRVRLMRGEEELGRTLVVLAASARRRQPVAAHDLPQGHVIGLDDLRIDEVLVHHADAAAAPGIEDLVGRSLRNRRRSGEAITLAATRAPVLVAGGATVSVVYRHDRFEVTASAVALASGAQGDRIRIRQMDGGIVQAVVEAPGVVAIAGR